MNHEEQKIADEKMRAKIAEMIEDAVNIGVRDFIGPAIFTFVCMGIGVAFGIYF